jgi:hypothetical protein
MILSKKYLNEMVQQNVLLESKQFFDSKRSEFDSYDIFFSYSFADKEFAAIVVQLLEKHGFSVYIDYKDKELDRNKVDRKTADTLAKAMNKCRCLLYLHSKSSKISKWCPWELGYMSGKKNFRCATVPLIDTDEKYEHQEYLLIYPYIDYEKSNGAKKEFMFWVNDVNDSKTYVSLKDFINGHSLGTH